MWVKAVLIVIWKIFIGDIECLPKKKGGGEETEEEEEFDLAECLGKFQEQITILMNANMEESAMNILQSEDWM